ncbi:exopolysaccharide biosynthesis polyprenyl glycosylphosphotransferase [Flavobacteriaceae bacterium S356]|uniref:Exopolysaccharide biosynthesis polyprenyl glycosylphosphotransferase n=1 Tax=Asprobacillus argus TaxID=3076534 RepID=A0ABU3LD27_9FLAO|nr:exopolysaccharide biosynthesis polyprenyl glycosylphosphotransferase [Flavobacteriaceae bacterium S356]
MDIFAINFVTYYIGDVNFFNLHFLSYIMLLWFVTSYFSGFYKVYRFTNVLRIITLSVRQFLIFTLGYFAYFGIFREGIVINNQLLILISILLGVTFFKFLGFFLLKQYRSLGKNYRTTVVLGFDDSSKKVIKIFKSKANLGYKFLGFFSSRTYKNPDFLGTTKECFEFIKNNEVDEVYCSLTEINESQIKELKKFTNERNIILKLIPNSNELYSKNQDIEFYDNTLVVLNVKKLPFEFAENFYIKRIFDVVFSLCVCVLILSWLIPILWILVKLESKGPLIFKQPREGLNGEHFVCYKFRSMKINLLSDKVHATKNDTRVTKVGAFLRKTSIDELPQFVNVLLGDMSVVGPRPHLESLSIEYQKEVEDYLKRHIVKPGITGLAQVSGYRGEIKKKSDIKNRIRLDIFYIENWSFFLDIKIIIKTLFNVFEGEEKAY